MRRLLLLALPLTLAACAVNRESIKEFFAPDFRNLDDTQLQDGMWRLGRGVQDLDDTFRAEGLSEEERHAQIMSSLDLMAGAAAAVNDPNQKKSHTNVAMNIEALAKDIDAAKTAAAAKDYELAKALPQTCLHCHQGGGGGPQKQ
jgi:hypothetical protein